MAELLKEICLEKKIPAHRVAVCLSPEVAFQRVIQLPADLTVEQARLYVLDPANGIQIPFPYFKRISTFVHFLLARRSLKARACGIIFFAPGFGGSGDCILKRRTKNCSFSGGVALATYVVRDDFGDRGRSYSSGSRTSS